MNSQPPTPWVLPPMPCTRPDEFGEVVPAKAYWDLRELATKMQSTLSEIAPIHPDNVRVMIDSLLSVVQYDMRDAAKKDLDALVAMLSAPSAKKPPTCAECGQELALICSGCLHG